MFYHQQAADGIDQSSLNMARGDGSSAVQQDNNSMLHQSSMMMENKMETNMNQLNAPVSFISLLVTLLLYSGPRVSRIEIVLFEKKT